MKYQYEKSFPSFRESIFHQLASMLASPDLDSTPLEIAFLKFVVDKTLAGKGHEIKDYTVATEVFGRGPDYDRSIDPIVSIRADLLRRALAGYYETAGKNDPILIDIPQGTYIPVFKKRKLNET
jgi:hypothetical protein